MMTPDSAVLTTMRQKFGERLQTEVELARYTSARVGGPAEVLLVAHSANELAEMVTTLWELELPFLMLGGGSNVLVEWAAGIPGTLGGAVVGNAGAFGADLSANLVVAEILHHIPSMEAMDQSPVRREQWAKDRFEYAYRSSVLKKGAGTAIVLSARLQLERSTAQVVQARMDEHTVIRHRTQPPGASTGSMFKNPPGNYAGRLIDAAGLKGTQIGGAQISPLHGNFFINLGKASASELYQLVELAQRTVAEKYGIDLELEIQLVGDWPVVKG
jgi:UDP-N-acetylmuramate dehydrogenase